MKIKHKIIYAYIAYEERDLQAFYVFLLKYSRYGKSSLYKMLYILVQMALTPLLSIAMILRMILIDTQQLLAHDRLTAAVNEVER
jgi:hypothetical protein